MIFFRRWKYLIPTFRRAEERDMQEELDSLAAMSSEGELGNLTRAAERRREAWGWTRLEQLARDVRYAARSLRKSPAFTAAAVVSLGLGIGANTAIFTLIDALMLRWLPVHNPQELVQVTLRAKGVADPRENFNYPLVRAFADQEDVLAGAAGFSGANFSVGRPGALIRTPGAWVSGAFYETLGLKPEAGRLLTRQDDETSSPVVAVLSYNYWQRQFAASPAAVGQSILINGYPVTIAGVSPPGFNGANVGSVADITLPLAAMVPMNINGGVLLGPGNYWLRVLARPRMGVSVAEAKARLNAAWPAISAAAISPGMPRWLQEQIRGARLELTPGGTGWTLLRARFEKPLLVLMTIVALVLLIACANVANLSLARGAARRHEVGIRLAIGAGRWRIARQFLIESALISLCGGLLGVALAVSGSRALLSVLSSGPFKIAFDLTPNLHLLAFTGAVALACAILFGLAPALEATEGEAPAALKEDARMSHSGSRLRSSLVSLQVALSLVLTIGSGLFLRTLQNLRTLDPGFESEGVLLAGINEQRAENRPPQLTALFNDLVDRIEQVPGVLSASVSDNTPMSGGTWSEAAVPKGQPLPDHDSANFIAIGPRYFETMRTPLVSGREFTERDGAASPMVAIVNEAFARRYFPGRDPVGSYITATVSRPPVDLQIVGVAKNMALDGLRSAPPPAVYVSYFQRSQLAPTMLNIRVTGNFADAERAIRAQLQPRLPKIPLDIHGLSEQVEGTLLQERLMAMLASAFGVLALALAAVGLYGVLAYAVARRRNEIGIRFALGARQGQVLGMIVRDAARLVAIGIAIGLPAAWAASRFISSMLFGVTPMDTATVIWATATLALAGLMAGFLPAWRASRVNPMETLRNE
ncbi:MAG TPA: ABC transporter permease [Bryobacteraceae bacterium]|jgi:predicted permease